MGHVALGSIFCSARRATDLRASCPPAGVSPNPTAAQPPATFRHCPDMNMCWQGGPHACLWPFLLVTRVLQGTAGAESGAEVPPFPASIATTLPWHAAPAGQLPVTKKQHERMELQIFPTNTPNDLCCTSFISLHSSYLGSLNARNDQR